MIKYTLTPLDLNSLKKIMEDMIASEKSFKVYSCRKSGSTFVSEYWKMMFSSHLSLNPQRCVGGTNLVRKIENDPNEFRIGLIRNPFGLLRSYACHGNSGVNNCARGKDLYKIPELVMSGFESCRKEGRDSDFIGAFQEDNPYNNIHTKDGRVRVHVLIKTELLTKVTEKVMRPLDLLVKSSKESNKWGEGTRKKDSFFRDFNTQEIKPVNTIEDNTRKVPSFEEFFFSEDQSPWTEKLYNVWKPWFDKFHYDKEGNSTSDAVAFLVYED